MAHLMYNMRSIYDQIDRVALDDLDYKMVALLRSDARRPVASLAAELGVSRATVRSRIDRLIESGLIRGFTIAVHDHATRNLVRAVMMVEVEGKAADKVVKRLHGYPEVRKLHSTNGHWDLVAELVAGSLGEFDALLNRIRSIDGIKSTETSILLFSPKDTP
jgi:DNA-binding Lrp family transcriptional regulator